jgi:hypothetical protein
LVTGQAAGTAAGLKALRGVDPSHEDVQHVLLKHGALLDRHDLVKTTYVEEPEGRNLSHHEALKAEGALGVAN